MLNGKAKKQALKRLEKAHEGYADVGEIVQNKAMKLLEVRKKTSKKIRHIENYINLLANSPKEYNKTFEEINIYMDKFQSILDIKYEDEKNTKISGGVAGAGAVAGAGVAAFGPTAAMAVATTFGTASTGTAISALSGAAASKAALAWLGGGALAKGGGGIVAGKALLALSGPVGWAIGGAAITGGALFARKKNKEIAEKAQEEAFRISKETKVLEAASVEIEEVTKLNYDHLDKVSKQLKRLVREAPNDYLKFNKDQKADIGSLVNNTLALSKLINRKIGKEN